MQAEKCKVIETENRLLVARVWGWHWGKWGDVGQRAQTSSYMMKFWGYNIQYG